MECNKCKSDKDLCKFHNAVKAATDSMWPDTHSFAEYDADVDYEYGYAVVEICYDNPEPGLMVDTYEADNMLKKKLHEHLDKFGTINLQDNGNGFEIFLDCPAA